MKKLLSLMLAAAICLSLCPFAFAEDTVEIDLAVPTVRDWKLVEGGDLEVHLTGAPKAVANRSLWIVDAAGRAVARPGSRSSVRMRRDLTVCGSSSPAT